MRTVISLLTVSLLALMTRPCAAQNPPSSPVGSSTSPDGLLQSDESRAQSPKASEPTREDVERLRREVAELKTQIEQLRRAMSGSRAEAARTARPAASVTAPFIGDAFQEAKKTLARFKLQKRAVREEAQPKVRELRARIVAELKKIEERCCREAKLDEAVAVRDCLRGLEARHAQALPDPGMLHADPSQRQVLYFRVTGSDKSPVWGTDVYTADASLAAAAVHAGAVKVGQTGLVKVTTIPQHPSFEGSLRNGIQSASYGPYAAFTVEPAGDDEGDADEEEIEVTLPADRTAAQPAVTAEVPGSAEARGAAATDTSSRAADAELPADAREVVEQLDRDSQTIWKEANRKIGQLRRETILALTPLRDALTRAARLEEAVAVRDCIRGLKEGGHKIEADPGSLSGQNLAPGAVRYFRVAGAPGGSVWGTDIYTSDSKLAAAALHAGVLRLGESGVVKVTILPGQSSYAGSDRHGVTTSSYGAYPLSFRLARVDDVED